MLLSIEKYPIYTRLGVFPQEHLAGQEVWVSVYVELEDHAYLDYTLLFQALDDSIQNQDFFTMEDVLSHTLKQMQKVCIPEVCKLTLVLEKPVIPQGLTKGARVRLERSWVPPQQKTNPPAQKQQT